MIAHLELEIDERIAAPVTLEAFTDLLEWYAGEGDDCPGFSPPLCLGQDMRAKFGDAAFETWRDLMWAYEPPGCRFVFHDDPDAPIERIPLTEAEYESALVTEWADFDRPHRWTDHLIIDAMSDAQRGGWEPCGPPEIVDAIESVLNDLATRSGAKRAAREAEEDRLDAIHYAKVEAKMDASFAVYEAWVAAGEPDSDPMAKAHQIRKLAIARYDAAAEKAVPIPATVLDMHKQQRDQYNAAMIGPLPEHPELPIDQANSLSRYWAHLPSGKMIFEGTRDLWSAASLDKHIGRIKDAMSPNGPGKLASTFLSQFRGVQAMGWDPSEPMIIEDRVLTQEGWIPSKGDRTFNRYLPPSIPRIKGDVSLWLDHMRAVYPAECDHMVKWFAHRAQRPGDKINHALVLIGAAGIGKDTIIEPVTAAIGRHNFQSITAQSFFTSDFNAYLKSVMLRIDEVHDLGGESKYAFHDRTKPVIAAPPTMHHINEKFVPHYAAKNVCGVILTSNHRDALYLTPDDRRHYVCVSDRSKEDFTPKHFNAIYSWLDNGGNEAVAHYLANLDLSDFNPKAPPPRTEGWHMLVGAGLAPEAGDLADAIDALGNPAALTIAMIRTRTAVDSPLWHMFHDPKSRKALPKRLAECGYVVAANPDARDSGGRWRTSTGRIAIYARQELSEHARVAAARLIVAGPAIPPPPY